MVLHAKSKLSENDVEDFINNPDQFVYFNLECYKRLPGVIRPSCYLLTRLERDIMKKEHFIQALMTIPIQDEFDFEASLFLFSKLLKNCSDSTPIPSIFISVQSHWNSNISFYY